MSASKENNHGYPVEKLIIKRTDEAYELYADEELLFKTDNVEALEEVLDAIYNGEDPQPYIRRAQ